jgi:hypothetical protein
MYYSDVPGNYTILRAYLDGSEAETILTIPQPYRFCRTIVLDVEHQKMYLSLYDEASEYTHRAIARANMDGTGYEILIEFSGDTGESVSGGMVLYLP